MMMRVCAVCSVCALWHVIHLLLPMNVLQAKKNAFDCLSHVSSHKVIKIGCLANTIYIGIVTVNRMNLPRRATIE